MDEDFKDRRMPLAIIGIAHILIPRTTPGETGVISLTLRSALL